MTLLELTVPDLEQSKDGFDHTLDSSPIPTERFWNFLFSFFGFCEFVVLCPVLARVLSSI